MAGSFLMMGCGVGRRSRRNAKSTGNENGMYRQGDILIIPTKTIPKGLQVLRVDDPDHGELRLKEMRAAWDRFRDASETRQVAALASGDRDGLRRLDPLSVLDKRALALVAGENPKGEKQ